MNVGSTAIGWVLAAVGIGLLVVPLVVGDDDAAAAGFSGYIQSGTCAQPSDEFEVDLESEDSAYDVEPYVAVGDDGEPVTLGYYGASGVPGFGLGCDLHRPAVLDGDRGRRHRRSRRLRRHPPPRCRRVRGSGPGPGAAAARSGRATRRTPSKGSLPSSGPRSSASWTSRRPGSGSSSPPDPSARRPKRLPGTTATSRAGGASRRPETFTST